MKPGRGKQKGSAFERWVARELSRWLTEGKSTKQLIRSVLSGGWESSKQGEGAWRHAGDLAPNGPKGEAFRMCVVVECKHYREVNLWPLWHEDNRTSMAPIWQWWRQVRKEAAAVSTIPMLVFKANASPVMVMLPSGTLTEHGAVTVHGNDPCLILPWETLRKYDPNVFTLVHQSKFPKAWRTRKAAADRARAELYDELERGTLG